MAPILEQVLTMRLYQDKESMHSLSSTKSNASRFISPLSHGYLRGPGISADLLPGGSDWLFFDQATGTARLDARVSFRDKASGSTFYVQFLGIVQLDKQIQLVIDWSPNARTTESSQHYNFTSPVIEVSDEKDKWMERTAFVGHGHYHVPGDGTQAVEYEIYKLVTG